MGRVRWLMHLPLLCPVYIFPADDASQNQVRDKSGRGLLYPDTFAEDRLMLAPPAVIALLVIFSRNHNVSRFSCKCDHLKH